MSLDNLIQQHISTSNLLSVHEIIVLSQYNIGLLSALTALNWHLPDG